MKFSLKTRCKLALAAVLKCCGKQISSMKKKKEKDPNSSKIENSVDPWDVCLRECLISPGIRHPEDCLGFPMFHLNSLGLGG